MKSESVTTEQIWELFGEELRGFLLKRVSNEQVADDLLQETFVRIHKRLDGVEDSERITAWIYQIARNLLIDHYRTQSRYVAEIADDLEADTDQEENLNELVMGWLPRMISQLPDDYREAVELYELQRVPQQEIADRLGISLSGAKSRIQRGRAKLRAILFECCSFERDSRGNLIGYTHNNPGESCDGECDDGDSCSGCD